MNIISDILWQPQRLRWDFSNSSDWLPLFPGQPPAMQSVQVFAIQMENTKSLEKIKNIQIVKLNYVSRTSWRCQLRITERPVS